MKPLFTSLAALSLIALPSVALAHGEVSCSVPRAERQPQVRLQGQLKKQGWNVKKMQIYNGCYEVYGFDEKGESVEAFFDPRTLERIPVAP
ncbi:MAG TPA: PepSY domain-containing protein [Sphingobium sp.]